MDIDPLGLSYRSDHLKITQQINCAGELSLSRFLSEVLCDVN